MSRLKPDTWKVLYYGGQSYQADRYMNGKEETQHIHAHCLACAKTEILSKYGGRVDTRGWQKQGMCGTYLMAVAYTTAIEVNDSSPDADTNEHDTMKHTPGPWEYDKPDEYGNSVVGVGLNNLPDGYSVATVCSGTPEQTSADAQLIAAAPTLLEACIKAQRYIAADLLDPDFPSKADAIYKIVSDAISKATVAAPAA